MTGHKNVVTPDELTDSLSAMTDLDAVLGKVLPAGNIYVDGPAQTYVTEILPMARRTFGSIRLLMDWSLNTGDADRTEDAAALPRRLLDIYARFAFIAAEPPGANVSAMRCELSAAIELEKALRDMKDASSDEKHAEHHREWMDQVEQIKETLIAQTGEAKPSLSTTDIFKRISSDHVLLWRQSSDVLHAGLIGRSLQTDGTIIGAPSTPERQLFVMDTAIAVMADTARLWASILGRDVTEIERFGDEHNARIGASVPDPRGS